MTGAATRIIPLNQLEHGTANVRKTSGGKQAMDELKASIQAHGLLKNLVVQTVTVAGAEQHHSVIAGNRRLEALRQLAEEGHIPRDTPISCRILTEPEAAAEVSLAENIIRVSMHPADQMEAFAGLSRKGLDPKQIAIRFGCSKRLVEQRLRLGEVAPGILDAFRADKIDIDAVRSFTITPDHKRQTDVFKNLKANNNLRSYAIKRALTEERTPSSANVAKFIGIKAYRAAGGTITKDLFTGRHDSGTWLNDSRILHDLAHKKLSYALKGHSEGWKWTEARPELTWEQKQQFNRLTPVPAPMTDEETAQKLVLEAELVDADYNRKWELDRKIDDILQATIERGTFSAEQMAVAGVIATLDHGGELEILRGMIRKEDFKAAGKLSPEDHTPPDQYTLILKEAGISRPLADRLRKIRNNIIKSHLATHFGLAFNLAAFQFARSVLKHQYRAKALDITLMETQYTLDTGIQRLKDATAHVDDTWITEDNPAKAFEQFSQLSDYEKQSAFTVAVAHTLIGQLTIDKDLTPQLESVVESLNINFAAHFRPTAAHFWKYIPKAKLLKIATEVLGENWTKQRAKNKKGELIISMEAAFARREDNIFSLPEATVLKAQSWLPPGFNPEE